MKSEEYVAKCLVTASGDEIAIGFRLSLKDNQNLLHAALGLCTESSEFADGIKKHVFYGKPIDRVNLIEELGDLAWYMSLAMNELDVTWEEVWETNIAKLEKRYPDKFTEEAANNRDLDGERAVLEEG